MRITAKDSVCLIVDYQEKILPAIADRERLIENSVKLLQGLRILGIPMVMTAQYSKGLGVNIPPICEAAGMEKFSDKKTFSSAGCQEVLLMTTCLSETRSPGSKVFIRDLTKVVFHNRANVHRRDLLPRTV